MADKLVICACKWRNLIPKQKIEEQVVKAKLEGCEVEVVDDLCALLEDGGDKDLSWLQDATVIACHQRAVKSLMAWRNIKVATIVNLREGMGAAVSGHDAWYPTIDKERCTECGKCFDFCPFGVYEMVNERVSVVNPHNCKNNCPACARNCPSEAIIFPKYGLSPINGGNEQEEQALHINHSSLYADTIRTRLIERRNIGLRLVKNGGNKE
jgi:NAD-dependent dihydropyrimidine dehydrogenase PreA subunit